MYQSSSSRAQDKVRIFTSIMLISSPNPMFDHLLESSHRDDSNKWSNIGFGEEITVAELIEVHFTQLIWSPAHSYLTHYRLGYKMAAMKDQSAPTLTSLYWAIFKKKIVVLKANRLEPRSGLWVLILDRACLQLYKILINQYPD